VHRHKILVVTMNNYGKYYGAIKSKVCYVSNILFYNESKTNMVYGCLGVGLRSTCIMLLM